LGVGLDHRTVTFLQGIGLTSDDPTAEDLVEFNTNNFDWTDVRDLAEVEVFGATAIRVRVTTPKVVTASHTRVSVPTTVRSSSSASGLPPTRASTRSSPPGMRCSRASRPPSSRHHLDQLVPVGGIESERVSVATGTMVVVDEVVVRDGVVVVVEVRAAPR